MIKGKNSNIVDEPRINDEIVGCEKVRLVFKSEDGENKSIVISIDEARKKACREGKDLIEINAKTDPPILKIEDYSKYLYELKKQMKNNKKPSTVLKEVQLSTNIAANDLFVKANKAKKFIFDGDKVKVVLTMKGRELSRRDESKKCLYEFIEMLSDVSVPEALPRDEGNKCTVILKKKK
jgi:translation initiation factor IF-3